MGPLFLAFQQIVQRRRSLLVIGLDKVAIDGQRRRWAGVAQTRLDRLDIRIGPNEQSRLRMPQFMRLQPAVARIARASGAVAANDLPALFKRTEAVFHCKQPKRPRIVMSVHPGHKGPFAAGDIGNPNGMDNRRFSGLPHCK